MYIHTYTHALIRTVVGRGDSFTKPWLRAEEVTAFMRSSSSGITDVMVWGGGGRGGEGREGGGGLYVELLQQLQCVQVPNLHVC